MKRRHVTHALAAAWAGGALLGLAEATALAAAPGVGEKTLRCAFPVAETGFDPAQLSDLYSHVVTAHLFDAPLTYDHLARPFKLKPLVAEAMPEVSADFRTFTFRIRQGIYFADDPAFKGKHRELVAEDFVYAFKRIYDPKLKSPGQSNLEDEGIIGLRELREARPRHLYIWAARDIFGAVAREVVEAYGDDIMAHPVGTGPFRLARLAAQLAHRPDAQSGLSRARLRRLAKCRRC